MSVTTQTLSKSYYPADQSEAVLDTTVGGILCEAAQSAADEPALIGGHPDPMRRRRWTYGELLEDAERCARALLGRFAPGERVAVWAPNIPEWEVFEFGAALAGLVLVTINPAYKPSELSYVLEQSASAGIFLLPEFRGNPMAQSLEAVRGELPELREAIPFNEFHAFLSSAGPTERLPDVRPDDPVQIQYTSGTTGFPKGALLHHRGLTNNARMALGRLELSPGEVFVNPFPLFHTAGCGAGALGCVSHQLAHVPVLAFEPALMLDLIEAERAAGIAGVSTVLIALAEDPGFATRDLSSVRAVLSGGALVAPELVKRIEDRLGLRFSIVYGQTESSPVITQGRLGDTFEDRATTVGRPLPQTEVRIVDPATGETIPCGVVGELCTRGYLVMLGYYEMPDATAAAIDADGWLHTGDLASMDDRGYCRIEGRLKDMIIRGGENIFPREIEQRLFTHAAVGDVAVVGIPDEKWGEQVCAFVRSAPGATLNKDELDGHVRAELAAYKAPRIWVFVEELPMTPSGKVQKFVLRDRLMGGELRAV
jgi:acyl-CoA synthetase (AMP-forming)/AMP-acid ligase II